MDDPKGDSKSGTEDQKVKVGEKTYSAEDVKGLLVQAEDVGKKAQELSPLIKLIESQGMTADEFGKSAMTSFTVLGDLIDSGVIDKEGNVVAKVKEREMSDTQDIFNLKAKEADPPKNSQQEGLVASTLAKINQTIEGQAKTLESMQQVQTNLIRTNWSKELKQAYPTLDDEDVSKVFGTAMAQQKEGKTADLLELAKGISETKGSAIASAEKAFAEKHGLDYDKLVKIDKGEFEGPNLKEPSSFKPKLKEGERFSLANASEAANEYFKAQADES